ncbi:MAG: 4-carboxy-4-hydroxy-2-oxoadipate aldolase/oxaloacetate decarboxylase [Synergistaceae bacterium]|nr:4-carboxy-4-hydroxy-2-oxoadipate aldolase/oxaloacetate decarboxylase [Synergistaceae bacterium]
MYEYDVNLIHQTFEDKWIEKYSEFEESASINECMPVSGAMNSDIRPIWPGTRTCGRAFTVLCRAGDNLILQKALTMLKPGDILVISCDGFKESGGMFGGIMSTTALKRGCRGLITDGSVRDTMLMKEIGFPVWSRGICVKMSTKVTPGKINIPVVVGGVLVTPGDLIFADNDSVVVVPSGQVEAVYNKTKAREDAEDAKKEGIEGKPLPTKFNPKYAEAYKRLGLREEPGCETIY